MSSRGRARTMEESEELLGKLPATLTMNLLLKDKKHLLFSSSAHEHYRSCLSAVQADTDPRGKLGFACSR